MNLRGGKKNCALDTVCPKHSNCIFEKRSRFGIILRYRQNLIHRIFYLEKARGSEGENSEVKKRGECSIEATDMHKSTYRICWSGCTDNTYVYSGRDHPNWPIADFDIHWDPDPRSNENKIFRLDYYVENVDKRIFDKTNKKIFCIIMKTFKQG